MKSRSEPEYVCAYCAETFGRKECRQTAQWHLGQCDVCDDEPVAVTDPAECGGLYDTWKDND